MPSPLIHPIRLIGAQQIIINSDGIEPLVRFYGDLYARLTKEVHHTGDLTRYVGFQSSAGEGSVMHFFGIEVVKIECIPAGLTAWELTDKYRTSWKNIQERDVALHRDEIEWQWLSPSASGSGKYTGDFMHHDTNGSHPWWISANVYVNLHENNRSNDEVFLVEHDPSWKEQYQAMAEWIRATLGRDIVLRTEHFGSTAIPGISAKPVIDILVEIPSFDQARRRAVPLLNDPCWEYWWTAEHMLFIKRDEPAGQRTHHIHLATAEHTFWRGIPFRDYLRNHPEEAQRYADLKRELAEKYHDDRERYTDAKTDFVQEILTRLDSKKYRS